MTPDARLFPQGMSFIGDNVRHSGLRFGVWTAPFEVSERAWVFQQHKDWLVHNMAGEPLRIGRVTDGTDLLYVLDTTNPGAQEYLRQTYRTLTRQWGVRFIKMDFMEDLAVEGKGMLRMAALPLLQARWEASLPLRGWRTACAYCVVPGGRCAAESNPAKCTKKLEGESGDAVYSSGVRL